MKMSNSEVNDLQERTYKCLKILVNAYNQLSVLQKRHDEVWRQYQKAQSDGGKRSFRYSLALKLSIIQNVSCLYRKLIKKKHDEEKRLGEEYQELVDRIFDFSSDVDNNDDDESDSWDEDFSSDESNFWDEDESDDDEDDEPLRDVIYV